MGRVPQRIVARIELARMNVLDLLPDGDHRVAEAIEFGLALGLRRFHHERVGYRKGQRRRMEAEIHQPFGDVSNFNSRTVLELTHVYDELMRDKAVRACV